jgi:hypothetical protein
MKDLTRIAPSAITDFRVNPLKSPDQRQPAQFYLLAAPCRIAMVMAAVILLIANVSTAFADGAVISRTSGIPLRHRPKRKHHHHQCCHCGRPAPLFDTCAGQWGDTIFPDSTIGEFPIAVGDFSSGIESGADVFSSASSGGSMGGGSARGTVQALPPTTNREFWTSYNSTIDNSTVQTSNSWITETINQPPDSPTCNKPPVNVGTVPDSGPGALFPVSLAGIVWLHLKCRRKFLRS